MLTNGLIGMAVACLGFIGLLLMCGSETRENVEKALRKEKM